ncbi:MAG: lytic murein transglycosylase [Alphaproteobacteria bacterium]|nr:lytic murein transglycosylase [Alphaproteobacteria bacterium]
MFKKPIILLGLCLTLAACGLRAQEADFDAWKQSFRVEAESAGVTPSFLDGILPRMMLLPAVVQSDRKQPEFVSTFGDYIARTISPKRIGQGRDMLAKHRPVLAQIAAQYNVQPHYIIAFWGLETNYGAHQGGIDTLNALTTLAYDKRRRTFFTRELIAFLKIIEQEKLSVYQGSWAGAFGNFQFMPTTFQAYAVDFDGDGRRDVVNSLPDAFASAANYLSRMGWRGDMRWGREVRLTKPLDWNDVHAPAPKPLSYWQAHGVLPLDRNAFPKDALAVPARLILPVGVEGPAYLAYKNFDIIMRWNKSELYALAVGLLADQIAYPQTPWAQPAAGEQISTDMVKKAQLHLTRLGYYDAQIDGQFGRRTKKAVRAYQARAGLPQDGYLTRSLLNRIQEEP